MNGLPKKLKSKLDARKNTNALRQLVKPSGLIDFSSNDYLGFSKSETIFNNSHRFLVENHMMQNGATGSRLLSGNSTLFDTVETMLSKVHNTETALLFNSGYDANMGFFSSVPQRGDIILYDAYIHASIRDGIKMSNAKAFKFKHHNLSDLEQQMQRYSELVSASHQTMYIVTESVFSMDGDSPDLVAISALSKTYNAYLIVDEAHALGVFGKHGVGLVQQLNLENEIFARIITFGKALGCHGAAILGRNALKAYLVNFSRSFIYTTALPPHSLATIHAAYQELVFSNTNDKTHAAVQELHDNIQYFKFEIERLQLFSFPSGEIVKAQNGFIESHSAIHCCVISGNDTVKFVAKKLQDNGFDVKPILSPTVPKGEERLRFCLHRYNSEADITNALQHLAKFLH